MDIKKILNEFQPNNRKAILWFLNTIFGLGFWIFFSYFFLYKSFTLFIFFILLSSLFFLKIFTIQHDCGHYSFFKTKRQNDFFWRLLSIITLTPYAYWQRFHNLHHAFIWNLDSRWEDWYVWWWYWIITQKEYQKLSIYKKMVYIIYHYPLFLIFIWPFLNFLLNNRLPFWKTLNRKDKKSIIWNSIGVFILIFLIYVFFWFDILFYVLLPIFYISSVLWPWLFMVQHNYENTYWERSKDWNIRDASLNGSSFYLLPSWLHYLTGNVWYHHIHHMLPTIPSYFLADCYKKYKCFYKKWLKISESFSVPNLCLWDEENKKLIWLYHFRYVSISLYIFFLFFSFFSWYLNITQILFIILFLLFWVASFPIIFSRNALKCTFLLTICGMNYLYFYYLGNNVGDINILWYSFAGVFIALFFLCYFSRVIFISFLKILRNSFMWKVFFTIIRNMRNNL